MLAPWALRCRRDLLDLFDQLTPKIHDLTRGLEEEVEKRPIARRLMTHPGVGVLTALAFELVIGTPKRFGCGKQIASYVGLVPSGQDDDKFIATQPVNAVFGTHVMLHSFGGDLEDSVPCGMAVAIVDGLEVIKIDDQDNYLRMIGFCLLYTLSSLALMACRLSNPVNASNFAR